MLLFDIRSTNYFYYDTPSYLIQKIIEIILGSVAD